MKITVLTPTYNRAHTIDKLFNSLNLQTCKDFEWLIIDDGSTDNTKELIENFKKKSDFNIRYLYKTNGGKHTAINVGVNNIDTKYTFIVDSDDFLTENAIETIINAWEKYRGIESISSIWFLQQNKKGVIVGDKFTKDEEVATYTNIIINSKIKGDKRAAYLTEIRKKFPFPVFEGEKFIGESTVHKRISNHYNSVFINKSIYVGEYLEDGLSKAGRNMRFKNPMGGIENSKEFLTKDVNISFRVKKMILYIAYSLVIGMKFSEIIKKSKNYTMALFCFPIAYIIYLNRIKNL